MVWAKRQPARAELWKPQRALPAMLVAAAHAAWNAHKNPSFNPYPEMWIAIGIIIAVYLILYAVHYAYQTVWNFVVISPADLHAMQNNQIEKLSNVKDSAYEAQSEKIKFLEAKIKGLETTDKVEADRRKVTLSASLKTEDRFKVLLMKISSQISGDQSVHAHVSEMTLVIYNHGEKAVRLRGCKLWILGAVESAQEFPLHDFLTPDAPATIQMTELLLRVISRQPNYSFDSLPGRYTIRVVVTYSQDPNPADSQTFDFQVACRHEGAAVKIVADEIKL